MFNTLMAQYLIGDNILLMTLQYLDGDIALMVTTLAVTLVTMPLR